MITKKELDSKIAHSATVILFEEGNVALYMNGIFGYMTVVNKETNETKKFMPIIEPSQRLAAVNAFNEMIAGSKPQCKCCGAEAKLVNGECEWCAAGGYIPEWY